MSAASSRPRRLRNRLMAVFAGFTLLVAALFGLYTLVFMYAVEDSFFNTVLTQERQRQQAAHAREGHWIEPAQPFIRLYHEPAQFPAEWRDTFLAEPQRREFPGSEGRHYHLKSVTADDGTDSVWLVAEVSRQLVVRPIRGQVLWLLAGTALAAVILALLLGWWLARRTTASLSRLATTVNTMTPDRLPTALAQGLTNDEVAILARGLDALIGRVRDFVEREKTFTRDASHELRTPLAVIRSSVERLADDAGLSATSHAFLGRIRQSLMQLEQTLELLLSLAREEHARDRAMMSGADVAAPTRIMPVLERVIVDRFSAESDDEVPLRLTVPDHATLPMPASALTIVMGNLVGNALSHRQGGVIDIDWRHGRLCVANQVADTGASFDPALRDAFGKRDDSPGWGLGLAIIDRLCARHGIDLRIEHERDRVLVSIGPA